MFAYIEGRVTEKYADAMVVEAGGVGFLVSATPQTISSVSGSGARCRVYTKVVAKKDDVWEIYGFATREGAGDVRKADLGLGRGGRRWRWGCCRRCRCGTLRWPS